MERQLVRRAMAGDNDAFASIVESYQGKVFSVAMGVLRNREDALDVTQDTFLRAYRNLHSWRGDNLSAWLCRIASNAALDLVRRQKKQVLWEDFEYQAAPEAENPDRLLLQSELSANLSQAIDGLPLSYRTLVVLRHVGELPYQEIADSLDLSLSQVKNRLMRARQLLRTELTRLESGGVSSGL